MRRFFRVAFGVFLASFVIAFGWLFRPPPASALPSYARQTGQPCSACHMGYPELTPTGRAFKLNGYVWPGGTSNLPPIAFMLQPAFTHTDSGQPGGAAPHFGANNNFALQQGSIFYGGAIDADLGLGAFAQLTYDSASHRFGWDNTDIRMARTGTLGDTSFVYGLTLNNNPTVQDAWATLPAWRFPYIGSTLAPTPTAATLIEGGLAQQVLGLGAYTFWNNLVYVELSGYRSLSTNTQTFLGIDTTGESKISGVSPYWRVAVEPSWGSNSFEFGTFGLANSLSPQGIITTSTDDLTDVGFDTEYQYVGTRDDISVQASWIHESQAWNASQPLGLTANSHDTLQSFNVKTSYLYDQRFEGSLGYFRVYGTTDPGLYAPAPISGSANASPNSSGFTAEVDYMPFNNGGPALWPWLNAKVGLQYVAYMKFNGGTSNYDGFGRNASANNTLFGFVWIAF